MLGFVSSYFVSGVGYRFWWAQWALPPLFCLRFLTVHWPALANDRGNLLPALIGVTIAKLVPDMVLAMALSLALSLLVMQMLHCLHPPGGAVAILPMLGGPDVLAMGFHLY